MKRRIRIMLWDLVVVLPAGGILYGTFELVQAKGYALGILIAAVTSVLGYLAFEMIYPMWFGRR